MPNFNPDTRESLIAKICDLGNEPAWTEFVQIYEPVVRRFIQRHGVQHADAFDIAQEVLCRVAKSIETWDGAKENSSFRGWLYRITRNLSIDFLRKRAKEKVIEEGSNCKLSQFPEVSRSDSAEFRLEYERQIFHWAAEQLKPAFKPVNWQAFWLSTVEGMSIEDVSEHLKIDVSAVYVARSRITAKLSILVQARLKETNDASEFPGEQL